MNGGIIGEERLGKYLKVIGRVPFRGIIRHCMRGTMKTARILRQDGLSPDSNQKC
jgi:hypothetical protein